MSDVATPDSHGADVAAGGAVPGAGGGTADDAALSLSGTGTSVRWRAAGAMSFAIVVVARLWASAGRREFAIWPDEPAQLAMARFLGGGTRWNMHDHSTWRPGYATVLAPVHWFTSDPTLVFRSALVLNAVLGGIAAALLVQVARRLTSMSPLSNAAVVSLVAVSPAMLFHTDFVWSESLVVPLFVGSLLMLLRFAEAPTLRCGLAAGLLASAAFATHSRMVPLSLITVGLVALAARHRRLPTAHAVVVVAWTAVTMVAVSVYSRWIVERLWDEPSNRNSFGGAIAQLTRPGAILVSLAGQTWYLLVSTVGLIACGVVALARTGFGRDRACFGRDRAGFGRDRAGFGRDRGGFGRDRSTAVQLPEIAFVRVRNDARVVLVTVGACVALSVAFMADRWRPDQLVYGRYNDAVIGPILIVGIATLIGRAPTRRVVHGLVGAGAATVALAGVLWTARRALLAESNGLEPMILGLQPFVRSASSVPLWPITVSAIALMAVLVVLAINMAGRRWGVAFTLAVLAGFVVVGAVRTRTVIDRDWFDRGDGSAVGELRTDALEGITRVDFLLPADSDATGTMMLYQMYLPDTSFTVVTEPTTEAAAATPSAFVFAPIDEGSLSEHGARIVWSDPRRNVALWER